MNRELKLSLLMTASFLLPQTALARDLNFPQGNNWFYFHILEAGDSYSDGQSTIHGTYNITDANIRSFNYATQYWETILRPGSAATSLIPILVRTNDEPDDNAGASSDPLEAGDVDAEHAALVGRSQLAAQIINNYRIPNDDFVAFIEIDKLSSGKDWSDAPVSPLPQGDVFNLSSTMAHELLHALGVSASVDEGTVFGNTITKWDEHLRSTQMDPPIAPEAGMKIVTKYEYDIVNCTQCFVTESLDTETELPVSDQRSSWAGVYFTGEAVLDVLDGATIKPPTDAEVRTPVEGLPVNAWEYDSQTGKWNAEFSHIELQNSLMSHQNYRNWGTFMEAELAVLQDLGYTLDRGNFYGYSVYGDNDSVINNNPFYARENGQYIDGKPNTSPFGIGLHIYGSSNNVTQNADLLADGTYGIGIRVDGSDNRLNIPETTRVTANGENGYGVLFSYGQEHDFVMRGTVEATGKGGKAIAFDFGDNMLGNNVEYRGSYIQVVSGAPTADENDLLPELQGALINSANITGSVSGSEAAIYIGPSAYVDAIHIMNGASINGDIVSEWEPATDQAMITHANPVTLTTDLTFGYTPDEDGVVTMAADENFNATVKGNIKGAESVNLSLVGGRLAVTGNIDVNSLETAANTTLSLTVSNTAKSTPVVRSASTIDIGGALTYTFDPALSGLNTGDVLTVLNANEEIAWLETDETFSLESIFDYYKFEYSYNQEAGTLGLKVTSAQSKTAGAQSSNAMTTSVISAVGNQIMGRLNTASSIGGGRAFVKGQSGGDTFKETGMWGKALYTHAHNSGDNPFKADIVGGVIGLDGKVSDSTTLGIAVAYSKTNGKAGRTEADAETYAGYLYGKIEGRNGWSYNLAAGYGSSRFDVANTPKFDVKFANAQAYVDYVFGKGFVAEGGVRYVFARQDEYTVGATTFKAKDTNTLTGVLGGRYVYESGRFGMQANLAAVYDFISDEATVRATSRGTSMFVNGGRLHRVGGEAGVAATYRTKTWEFELGYDAQVRKDYNDQTVSLKAGYRF